MAQAAAQSGRPASSLREQIAELVDAKAALDSLAPPATVHTPIPLDQDATVVITMKRLEMQENHEIRRDAAEKALAERKQDLEIGLEERRLAVEEKRTAMWENLIGMFGQGLDAFKEVATGRAAARPQVEPQIEEGVCPHCEAPFKWLNVQHYHVCGSCGQVLQRGAPA